MHLNDLPYIKPATKAALGKLGCWSERDVAKLSKAFLRNRPGFAKRGIMQIERMLGEFDLHFIDTAPKEVRLAELREREKLLLRDLAEVRQEIAALESN